MNESYPRLLERLCRFCGIISSYRSVTGETVALDGPGRVALLAAMGLEAGDQPTAKRTLLELEEELWRTALDPVHVARPRDFPLRLDVRLPDEYLRARWALTLIEENGRRHHGMVRPFPLRYRRTAAGLRALCEIEVPFPCPPTGYHTIELRGEAGPESHRMSLIVAPETAFVPEGNGTALAIQNYALYSRAPEFTGVGGLREIRALSAAFPEHYLGLSPVHALFYDDPERRSPYSPSSRFWLTPLLLDFTRIPEWDDCPTARELVAGEDFQRRRRALCAGDRVPYAGAVALRERIFEPLFACFYERHYRRETRRGRGFDRFARAAGPALEDHALFEALREHFARENGGSAGDPRDWPPGYEGPRAPLARRFARRQERRLLYFQYLQWNCALQLRALQRELHARSSGLYLDLAVGAAPDGSEVWCDRSLYAGASIGAPPDAFAPDGQNWGLAPFAPPALKARAYRPFIRMLRANMPRGGILRIDHVMGLARLYWAGPGGGGYVRYPFADLAGILALESRRRRCTLIGEDLGTVPEDLRAELAARRIFSFRVLYFEKDGDEFLPPAAYPEFAAAAVNTHDLPTLRGFLAGRDVELREESGSLDARTAALERERRRQEAQALMRLAGESEPGELFAALRRLIDASPARLRIYSLHDLLNESEQPNLPGTVDEYPNWKLRYSRPVEDLPPRGTPVESPRESSERQADDRPD